MSSKATKTTAAQKKAAEQEARLRAVAENLPPATPSGTPFTPTPGAVTLEDNLQEEEEPDSFEGTTVPVSMCTVHLRLELKYTYGHNSIEIAVSMLINHVLGYILVRMFIFVDTQVCCSLCYELPRQP